MPDGSSVQTWGRVQRPQEIDCPAVAELRPGQVLVACCDRCQTVGAVDRRPWLETAHDAHAPLAVTQRQIACHCGCRSVTLQVWPAPPHTETRPTQFYRWR